VCWRVGACLVRCEGYKGEKRGYDIRHDEERVTRPSSKEGGQCGVMLELRRVWTG